MTFTLYAQLERATQAITCETTRLQTRTQSDSPFPTRMFIAKTTNYTQRFKKRNR